MVVRDRLAAAAGAVVVTVLVVACSGPAFAPPSASSDFPAPPLTVADAGVGGVIDYALSHELALAAAWAYPWVARGDDGTTAWEDPKSLEVLGADGDTLWSNVSLSDYMPEGYAASEGVAVTSEWLAWVGGDGDDLFPHASSIFAVRVGAPHDVIAVELGTDGPDGNYPAPDARFHVTLLGDYVYWQEAVASDAARGNGQISVAIFRRPLTPTGDAEMVAEDAWYPTVDRCAPAGHERLMYIHDDLSSLASPRTRSVEAVDVSGLAVGAPEVLWQAVDKTTQVTGAAACGNKVVVGGVDRPMTSEDEAFLEWGDVFVTMREAGAERTLTWRQPDTMANSVLYVGANPDGAAFRVSGVGSEGRDYWWSWNGEPVYLTGFADSSAILQTGAHDVSWLNATDWSLAGPWLVASTNGG